MNQNLSRLCRGMTALSLSMSGALMGLTGVADQWRPIIDGALGTSSTKIINDDKFTSDYETSAELIQAHRDLGERMSAEGTVLLKNQNQALPLAETENRVTLLGMGSAYPFLGGTMGSTVVGDSQINLQEALEERGFELNPTMTEIYNGLGRSRPALLSVLGIPFRSTGIVQLIFQPLMNHLNQQQIFMRRRKMMIPTLQKALLSIMMPPLW